MKFTIYTQPNCSWCEKAKELLKRLGHIYREVVIGRDISVREFYKIIEEYTDKKLVPQIFTNPDGQHAQYIGGYDALAEYLENVAGGFGDEF